MKRGNGLLLLAAGALALIPLWCTSASFRDLPGTDNEAVRVVSELRPEYKPWFSPLFKPPSAEIERLLFGVQAAFGVALLGYCIAHLRAARNQRRDHAAHD